MTTGMNRALTQLTRRAEMTDPATLVETFVSAGPLLELLRSKDHQVVFGRRGTGKTHALTYLAETLRSDATEFPIIIDMRSVGSTGGIYNDPALPLSERGTRLLIDLLEHVHDKLVDRALDAAFQGPGSSAVLSTLDQLAGELSQIKVIGSTETEQASSERATNSSGASLQVTLSPSPSINASASTTESAEVETEHRLRRVGVAYHRIHVGAVRHLLETALSGLGVSRLWLLLDEWSSIPLDLQPLLADMIRRAFMPVSSVTVKLAAIEHRTELKVTVGDRDYIGLELGSDIAADLDLDDYMVFGNDQEQAKTFFAELLFKHVVALEKNPDIGVPALTGVSDFLSQGFTQLTAFEELVRAAEGVPRDAINIAILAAQRAIDDRISVTHVRTAARVWYQRDKEPAATAGAKAGDLLVFIMNEVIGLRRARAFMLRQGADSQHPLIRSLYDDRVLHLIKKGVSSHDEPGVRYNVFSIDYGCYVDLLLTTRAPEGLYTVQLPEGEEGFAEVPQDDYRSIRRAILDITAFEAAGA